MTDLYVKLNKETNEIELPPVNKDGIINYNLDIERLIIDGYKLFVEAHPELSNRKNHIEYLETDTTIEEVVVWDETQEEADARELEVVKEVKIKKNDALRDEALLQGVTYKNVLFDSDTDQKINLLATVSMMDDEQTIVWFGMDNQPLECDKQDLINIGGLITQLDSFCWNKNAEIKEEINEATAIEEVDGVVIDYTFNQEG